MASASLKEDREEDEDLSPRTLENRKSVTAEKGRQLFSGSLVNLDIVGSTDNGEPLQVVFVKGENLFALDMKALERIFLNPKVVDSKIAILSVAGSCRQGKSFLLNFFLRYLKARGLMHWLGDEMGDIDNGFPWSVGVDPQTTGIVIWSEPFFINVAKGETVALFLMDTQGAFNCESTVKECATIFSLSVMLSSIQIYNVMSNINEIDLQHLQFFAEYGRLAMNESSAKPFQHLVFLVRDWPYPYQYDYGPVGGRKLIEKRLQTFDSQHPELRNLRTELQRCFSRISCFLLPHPGLAATTKQTFKGQLKDINDDFKTYIFHLVPFLIGKENLVIKDFQGTSLTGKEMLEYFQTYFNMFQTNELPDPKSVLQMTSEANNLAATVVAEDHYIKRMKKLFGDDEPYAEVKTIQSRHKVVKGESVKIFATTPKMGGLEFSETYLRNLETRLDELLIEYLNQNEAKSAGSVGLTPGILFVTIVLLYFISGLLNFFYLSFLAFIPDLASYCMMGLLVTWIIVKYSGDYHDVSQAIDSIAITIWELAYAAMWKRVTYEMIKIPRHSVGPRLSSYTTSPEEEPSPVKEPSVSASSSATAISSDS